MTDEVLERHARDELDLAIGRFVAAIVATLSGVLTLALARTQVAFVVGVLTLLAGVGWIFAVRRASRSVRAGVVHRLTLGDGGFVLDEAETRSVSWSSVTSMDIDDDAATIEVRTPSGNTTIAPGFGGLGLVPLYEKLVARWRLARGDAQP